MKLLTLLSILLMCNYALSKENSNEITLGASETGGNAESSIYDLTTTNTQMFSKNNAFTFGGHYSYGEANEEVATRNYDVYLKDTHSLSKLDALYAGYKYESDEFAGFNRRQNYDIGYEHLYNFSEKFTLTFEAGYRYVEELTLNSGSNYFNKFRLYESAKYTFNKDSYLELWSEYLWNFDNSEDWMLSVAPSVYFPVSTAIYFKFGYQGDYRNVPAERGLKQYDYSWTTSLVAKF